MTQIRFSNSRGRDIEVVLEPWGEAYVFRHGDEFVVIFDGTDTPSPEMDYGDDTIAAYGWPGSTAQISLDGSQIGSTELAVPDIHLSLTLKGS